MDKLTEKLRSALRGPLPGEAAQYRMAHQARRGYLAERPDAREAAVLALLYPHADEPHLVLIQRPSRDARDPHRGQISFPGGRRETTDPDLAATALREAEEEVGVPADRVELLGALTPLYIPVSNFKVQPYVGIALERPRFRPQPSEVQDIIEAPFSVFRDPATVRLTDMELGRGLVLRGVPYFDVAGHVVWGATAMMLNELIVALEHT
jgi:8-oxo-dGTP pyrophosphatase MutT (NUDIX family)